MAHREANNYHLIKLFFILTAFIFITLAMTYPVWLHAVTRLPTNPGDPLLNTWIIAWDAHALLTDSLHLFDANNFFPARNTLAYSEHLLSTALLNMPILLAAAEPVCAYNFALLTSFIVGGVGMYLLLLHYTRNRYAAFLAGLAFAFNPYRFAAIDHLHLITTQWIPFALLYLDRYLCSRKSRDLALCILFWLLTALSSWHLAVFVSVILGIYLLYNWLTDRAAFTGAVWWQLIIGAVIIALIMLPIFIPYLKVFSLLRAARSADIGDFFAAHLSDYLTARNHNHLWGSISAPWRAREGFTVESNLFQGFLFPALALTSLWLLKRRTSRHLLLPLWLIMILNVALTFALPYRIARTIIPPLALIRVPTRWIIGANFAMIILGGFTLAVLFTRIRRAAPLVVLICAVWILLEGYSAPIHEAKIGALDEVAEVYHWLARQDGDFGVLELPLYAAPRRQEYPEAQRQYASTLHWKRIVNGYSGFTPPHYLEIDERVVDFPSSESLRAITDLGQQGLRYVIVHSRQHPFDYDMWKDEGQWYAARSTTLRLVRMTEYNYVYEVNPWGDRLLTAPNEVTGEWRERLPRRVDANFDDQVTLLAYELREHKDQNAITLTLYWQAMTAIDRDYTVFVHLLNAQNERIAQGDSPPQQGHYPMTRWQIGEIVRDEHLVQVEDLTALEKSGARFIVGLYDLETMARLSIFDEAKNDIGQEIVIPLSE